MSITKYEDFVKEEKNIIKVKEIEPYGGAYSDANGDKFYKDDKGVIYTQVDGEWSTCTKAGEPDCPVHATVVVEECEEEETNEKTKPFDGVKMIKPKYREYKLGKKKLSKKLKNIKMFEHFIELSESKDETLIGLEAETGDGEIVKVTNDTLKSIIDWVDSYADFNKMKPKKQKEVLLTVIANLELGDKKEEDFMAGKYVSLEDSDFNDMVDDMIEDLFSTHHHMWQFRKK